MFWARLRLILARAARRNINSITIIITLEGIEKMKTEKNDNKTLRRIFFHQRCEKTSANFEMASRFWLAA